jgi:hypothetical protein
MFVDEGVKFDLFGSALNTLKDVNYCSLFTDFEKYFGS